MQKQSTELVSQGATQKSRRTSGKLKLQGKPCVVFQYLCFSSTKICLKTYAEILASYSPQSETRLRVISILLRFFVSKFATY